MAVRRPQNLEEVVQATPQARVQHRTAEQKADIPMPQIEERCAGHRTGDSTEPYRGADSRCRSCRLAWSRLWVSLCLKIIKNIQEIEEVVQSTPQKPTTNRKERQTVEVHRAESETEFRTLTSRLKRGFS